MAKKKKYPKTPKQSASLTTWQNYHAKCRDVDKYNTGLDSDAKKKKTIIAGVQKLKQKR